RPSAIWRHESPHASARREDNSRSRMSPRLLTLAFLVAATLGAQPLGTEFRGNANTTGDQAQPAIASTGGGGFVVVWNSSSAVGSFDADIFGQRFDAAGARIGDEFQVNTFTTSGQNKPAIASDASGNFVVVWQGDGAGDFYGVFGQRFSS